MFTLIAIGAAIVVGAAASWLDRLDKESYQADVRRSLGRVKSELTLIALTLLAILVMLGIIADRVG